MVVAPSQSEQMRIRDQQEGGARDISLQSQIDALNTQITNLSTAQTTITATVSNAVIKQLWRNSDVCFSVDGWHNSVNAAGNQQLEIALHYTHVADEQITLYDGEIDIGINDLALHSDSAAFNVGNEGDIIIIDGAGAAGGRHSTRIDVYISPTDVTLNDSAQTTVTAARTRYGCIKLLKANAKISGSATTDSIKADTHSHWATNIQSPKWDIPSGTVHWGGNTNTITHFLGWADSSGNFYPQSQPLQGGRPLHIQFKLALKNKFIKPKGVLYALLWNNSDDGLEPLLSSDFRVDSLVNGTPAATATTQYLIVCDTDQGTRFVSRPVVVAGAPTEASYNPPGVQVTLTWPYLAGVRLTTIYRKIGAGNVFKLEEYESNLSNYTDVNNARRVDTGSAAFPTFPFTLSHTRCYAETSDFVGIVEDGNGNWPVMRLIIPFTATTSLAGVTDLAIVIGVSEPAVYEFPVTTVNGSVTITSPDAAFFADLDGLDATFRDTRDINLTLSTVANYTSTTAMDMDDAVPWDSALESDGVTSTTRVEVAYSDVYPYISDCFGLSMTQGLWAEHVEDTNRRLPVTSQPSHSTQGGIGPDPGTSGGTGGIDCMPEDGIYQSIDGPILGHRVKKDLMMWFGVEDRYNRVSKVRRTLLHDYFRFTSRETQKVSYGSPTHRLVTGLENRRYGTAMPDIRKDEKVLLVIKKKYILDAIDIEEIHDPEGKWFLAITFDHDPERSTECHLGICDDFLFHNRKADPVEPTAQ